MEKIKILIKYSKEIEQQRVLWTKERLSWYRDNKYNVNNLTLPENLNIEKLDKILEPEIIEIVNAEYNPELYQPSVQTINSLLSGYLDKLANYFFNINISILSELEIRLTRYGMTGSYNVPNIIVLNISKFFGAELIRIIIHETIHLHIQSLVDKYKIDQWQKEAIVDNLFKKVFPDMAKQQNYPYDISGTQNIFEKYYPDLELIMSNISKLKE